MTNWGKALGDTMLRLKQAGVLSSRLDARLLLAHAVGVSPEKVFSQPANPLSADEEDILAQLIERRSAREPMSHILGRREFWSLDFDVSAAVLDPRPDTETVVEAVLDRIAERFQPYEILDFGTGSGCILLSLLSELPQATGLGIDISVEALAVALANAGRLSLDHRARFLEGDWGEGIEGSFDVIVSNPPYIPEGEIAALEPEVARYEPRLALAGGPDGLACYRALAPHIKRLLAPGGIVVLEVGKGQDRAVAGILEQAGLIVVDCRNDLAGIARAVIATGPEEAIS